MAAKKFKKINRKELNEFRDQIVEYCTDAVCQDIGLDYTLFHAKVSKAIKSALNITEFFYSNPWLYKVDEDA